MILCISVKLVVEGMYIFWGVILRVLDHLTDLISRVPERIVTCDEFPRWVFLLALQPHPPQPQDKGGSASPRPRHGSCQSWMPRIASGFTEHSVWSRPYSSQQPWQLPRITIPILPMRRQPQRHKVLAQGHITNVDLFEIRSAICAYFSNYATQPLPFPRDSSLEWGTAPRELELQLLPPAFLLQRVDRVEPPQCLHHRISIHRCRKRQIPDTQCPVPGRKHSTEHAWAGQASRGCVCWAVIFEKWSLERSRETGGSHFPWRGGAGAG